MPNNNFFLNSSSSAGSKKNIKNQDLGFFIESQEQEPPAKKIKIDHEIKPVLTQVDSLSLTPPSFTRLPEALGDPRFIGTSLLSPFEQEMRSYQLSLPSSRILRPISIPFSLVNFSAASLLKEYPMTANYGLPSYSGYNAADGWSIISSAEGASYRTQLGLALSPNLPQTSSPVNYFQKSSVLRPGKPTANYQYDFLDLQLHISYKVQLPDNYYSYILSFYDDNYLFFLYENGICRYNTSNYELKENLVSMDSSTNRTALATVGETMIIGDAAGQLCIYNPLRDRVSPPYSICDESMSRKYRKIEFISSLDSNLYLTSQRGGHVILKDLREKTSEKVHKPFRLDSPACGISYKGYNLAIGTANRGYNIENPGQVCIYDIRKILNSEDRPQSKVEYTLHKSGVRALSFTPFDSSLIVTGGTEDGCINLWDINYPDQNLLSLNTGRQVTSIQWLSNNTFFSTHGLKMDNKANDIQLWHVDPVKKQLSKGKGYELSAERALWADVSPNKDKVVISSSTVMFFLNTQSKNKEKVKEKVKEKEPRSVLNEAKYVIR